MKYSKKALTAIAFTVGAATFITTAFADIAVGSGYDRLKAAIKTTSASVSGGVDNCTMEVIGKVKDNNKVLTQFSSLTKIDHKNGKMEGTSNEEYANGNKSSYYSYADKEIDINKNSGDETYYVNKYFYDEKVKERYCDQFKEKGAAEVEKVFDAVVGSLKDYVQVKEESGKVSEYNGSLSEAQIPAVANAVSSFLLRRQYFNGFKGGNFEFPVIESELFIKKISGSAVENDLGMLENFMGEVAFYGKDKDGVTHEMSFEFIFKLTDIGGTVVEKPDLAGKKVEENVSMGPKIDARYVGKYKGNIVIDKDDKITKIGERVVDITSITEDKITGRYYETYKTGFESYGEGNEEISFETSSDRSNSEFTYKNIEGKELKGNIDFSQQCIYFYVDGNVFRGDDLVNRDSKFIRDFDE